MKSDSVMEQLYRAVISVEEHAALSPRVTYLVGSVSFVQRLYFSITHAHRWLYKFPLLLRLSDISQYSGLYISFPQIEMPLALTTIALSSVLLCLFAGLVAAPSTPILTVGLGWIFSLGPLFFLPLLNINLNSYQNSEATVLAVVLTMAFFLLVFTVNRGLHRMVEVVPAVLLVLRPDLIYVGLGACFVATLLTVWTTEHGEQWLYYLVVEVWVAVWTLAQSGQQLDLNGSELPLFGLTMGFALLVLAQYHRRHGSFKEQTAYLVQMEQLIDLEKSKNFKQFYKSLDYLRLKHRVGCTKPECLCRTLKTCADIGHEESVSFLYMLIEQYCRQHPQCYQGIKLIIRVSINLEHFKMGGLLAALRAKELSESTRLRLKIGRLVSQFEGILGSKDLASSKTILGAVNRSTLSQKLHSLMSEGVAVLLNFWVAVADSRPSTFRLMSEGQAVLQLVEQSHRLVEQANGNHFAKAWAEQVLMCPVLAKKVAANERRYSDQQNTALVITCFNSDEEGEIVSVSQMTLQMTGFDRDDLVKSKVSQLLPPCMHDWHQKSMVKYLHEFVPKNVLQKNEKILMNSSNHLMPFAFSATLLPQVQKGIHVAAILSPIPEKESSLLVLHDQGSFKIYAFSAMIGQFLHEDWQQKRALSGVMYNDLVKPVPLITNGDQRFAHFYPNTLMSINEARIEMQLVQINDLRRYNINNDALCLTEILFENSGPESPRRSLPQAFTQKTESINQKGEESPTQDGFEYIDSILQLTMFYLALLLVLKGVFIDINSLKQQNYSQAIEQQDALAQQILSLLSLKSTLVLAGLGQFSAESTFVRERLQVSEAAHLTAIQLGWAPSATKFYSDQTLTQVNGSAIIADIFYESRQAIEKGLKLSQRIPDSALTLVKGTTSIVKDMITNMPASEQSHSKQGFALYVTSLAMAAGQVACLLIFLLIKYFPILAVSRVVGNNFSIFGKINLQRLVGHLARLELFKQTMDSGFGHKSQFSQPITRGFEDYVLDAEQRADNYVRLKNEANDSQFIKLPLIKLFTVVGFIIDVMVVVGQHNAYLNCSTYQSSAVNKTLSYAVYFDTYLNQYFQPGDQLSSLQIELHQVITLQNQLRLKLPFTLPANQSLCLESYPSQWEMISPEDCSEVIGNITSSGEISAVIASLSQMQMYQKPSPLSYKLQTYILTKYQKDWSDYRLQFTRYSQKTAATWVGIYLTGAVILITYATLVLLVIFHMKKMHKISHRLVAFIPKSLLQPSS